MAIGMITAMTGVTMTGNRQNTMHPMRPLLVTLAVMALLCLSGVAFAQDIMLEDTLTAEIEKPQAFYVLRATQLEYEAMEPKDSFLPELYETVVQDPFE